MLPSTRWHSVTTRYSYVPQVIQKLCIFSSLKLQRKSKYCLSPFEKHMGFCLRIRGFQKSTRRERNCERVQARSFTRPLPRSLVRSLRVEKERKRLLRRLHEFQSPNLIEISCTRKNDHRYSLLIFVELSTSVWHFSS